ncbi:uncharacterized protein LOC119218967 [Pungitius pungitius]|uniref:uncharacterized protein LOC119218967 n=1 Tax=Pungitius pungitius TaxID=134920 RepID=UPI002E1594D3
MARAGLCCASLEVPHTLMKMGLWMLLLGHVNFLLGALMHGVVLRHVANDEQAGATEYTVANVVALASGLVGIVGGVVAIVLSKNKKSRGLTWSLLSVGLAAALTAAASAVGLSVSAVSAVVRGGRNFVTHCRFPDAVGYFSITGECPFDPTRIYSTTLILWVPLILTCVIQMVFSARCFAVCVSFLGLTCCRNRKTTRDLRQAINVVRPMKEAAPSRHTEAPKHHTEAPTHHTEAPTRHPEAPTHHPEAPTRHPEAPTRRTEAPTRHTEAPTRHPEAPTQHTKAPTRHPEAPTRHPEAPTGHTEAPTGHTEAPTRHPEAPTRHTEAPTRHTEAPTRHPEAPTGHPEAPTRHPEAPTRHPEAPTGHPEAPTRRTQPPLRCRSEPLSGHRDPRTRQHRPAARPQLPPHQHRSLPPSERGSPQRAPERHRPLRGGAALERSGFWI